MSPNRAPDFSVSPRNRGHAHKFIKDANCEKRVTRREGGGGSRINRAPGLFRGGGGVVGGG
jgi:hypothetical protein